MVKSPKGFDIFMYYEYNAFNRWKLAAYEQTFCGQIVFQCPE